MVALPADALPRVPGERLQHGGGGRQRGRQDAGYAGGGPARGDTGTWVGSWVGTWSAAPTPRRGPPAGKAVYAETTTAHATLTGLHYYHQDWFHAAAYVTVPPLRLDTNTSAHLLSLLARYPPPGHLGAPRPHPQPLGALLPKHPTLQAPHWMSVPLPKDPAVWVHSSPSTLLRGSRAPR